MNALESFLRQTSNWKFRSRVKHLAAEIASESRYLESRLKAGNMAEVDVLSRRLHAMAKLLDRTVTDKKREL